jgi:hypothetical protein
MCNSCIGLVYDILTTPLGVQHPVRKHIHEKSLLHCARELAPLLYKIIEGLPTGIYFISNMTPVPEASKPSDPFEEERTYCLKVARKYTETFPEVEGEMRLAIITLVEHAAIRKTKSHLNIAEQFFLLKFKDILLHVPDAHMSHLNKDMPENTASTGKVPDWKIDAVRIRYNLPPRFIVTPPLEEIVVEHVGGRCGGPPSLGALCIKIPIEDESLYW